MFYSKLAWQNIKNNRQFYLPYMFASMFTVGIFFIMVNFVFNDSVKDSSAGNDIITVMTMGAVIVGIFATIFLFYSNSFLIKRRKREFGLYNILGMEKRHISKVIFFETLYTYVITSISGIGVGLLLFKLLHLLLSKLMDCEITLGFEFHIEPILITLALFFEISLTIYGNCIRQIYVSNPIELLKGGRVGEREPKSNYVLAILGTIFLVAGYCLAVFSQNAYQAIETFFVAVICVIIGTYLLFTAGSIVMFKTLRKNKKFYYKINHFTAVSGMIYRMKQNAIGLGNIAILSTMTIIAVSGSVSLYFGVDGIVNERYPNDIEVVYYSDYVYQKDSIPSRDDLRNTIQETLNETHRTMSDFKQYDTLSITVMQTDTGVSIEEYNSDSNNISTYLPDDISVLFLMTLEDYNALTSNNISLNDDEILMFSQGYDIPKTFSIDDANYTVTPLDSFPIDAGYYNMTNVSEIYVVLKNQSQLDDIYKKQLEVCSYPSMMNYVVNFNIDGTDDEKISFSETLGEKLKLPVEGKDYYINPVNSKQVSKKSCYSLYGSILFLGVFLGVTFLMATGLIIYYKQLSEGYEDRERFNIMQKVGLSKLEIRRTIRTQVLMVFFLPLVTAIIHTAFAFPMLTYLLKALALNDVKLFLICTSICILIFTLIYILIYSITAKVYFKITTS